MCELNWENNNWLDSVGSGLSSLLTKSLLYSTFHRKPDPLKLCANVSTSHCCKYLLEINIALFFAVGQKTYCMYSSVERLRNGNRRSVLVQNLCDHST